MIARVEAWLRLWRRRFSRTRWLARLMGFSLPAAGGNPGLVLIQIDGLAHPELTRALERGEMPFLKRLLAHEHYRPHHLYSGIPATTPAVQAELFYGVSGAVPGFSFRESESGRLVRMYDPQAAARVERRLQAQGNQALLEEGSCYVSNFCGGAAEPHYCPAALGWGPTLRDANPLVLLALFASNFGILLRAGVLMFVELLLAVTDCVRGIIEGQKFLKELLFVPTRIVITILLRDLATMGVKIDIARGLPVIHLNFLGYDEQAHRRGPDSAFAHWTLKGIDRAIARIWRSAHASTNRHYDVWIYSDHGQEHSVPYSRLAGCPFPDQVEGIVARWRGQQLSLNAIGQKGIQLQRVRLFGGSRIQRLFPVNMHGESITVEPALQVASLGPVAHIYCPLPTARERRELARLLVTEAHVPVALYLDDARRVQGWDKNGELTLPDDGPMILGADHPYLEEVLADLQAMCGHREAGDVIAVGWRAGGQAISFAEENGAHGGASPRETDAFLLIPEDIAAPTAHSSYWRPRDIRDCALAFLGRLPEKTEQGPVIRAPRQRPVRIMTYNVHSCIGMDGRLSPERIARIIARCEPDIVALQELDVGRARTESIDQAAAIAELLSMDFHFHPAIRVESERYGDAILSRLPMELAKAGTLPGLDAKPWLEPRGALWVKVDVDGTRIQVFNTHLGLLNRERKIQTEALLGEQWLGHPDCEGPVILCGDFNAGPGSSVYRLLNKRLVDTQVEMDTHKPGGTFFGRFPKARIDHIFVTQGTRVLDIDIPRSEMVKLASDHLPLVAEIQVEVLRSGSNCT